MDTEKNKDSKKDKKVLFWTVIIFVGLFAWVIQKSPKNSETKNNVKQQTSQYPAPIEQETTSNSSINDSPEQVEVEEEVEAEESCDTNYEGACVPVASDVDCYGGSGNGPAYVAGPVRVTGTDVYGLDRDGDGIGCE